MRIRPALAADRERIHEILVSTAVFTQEEIDVAMELVDAFVDLTDENYVVDVVEDDARAVQGYVCFGPTPLTDGVFDLYWIAVDPKQQGHGFGQILIRYVENEVRRRSGRMLLIETSSKEMYGPTVRFYERSGYDEISRIKDFYRIADDKVVFCKRLASS